MGPTILVTGGAGYIGSHACKALALAGFTPVAFDNLSLGAERFVRWGPLVRADARDADAVADAIRTHDCQAVIHFAAVSSVGESVVEPGLYYDNNLGGLTGLLAGMRAAGCGAMVFSSSAAVYGQPDVSPIPETAPARPINPYGHTKATGETMLADHGRAYGLRSIALRYFNAAGADPDGETGEDRKVETHLIPRALMAVTGRISDFQVFGSDFPTPDGTAIRDYIHVSDLADAHVLALRRVLDRPVTEVFNVGAGTGHSVAQVLAAVSAETGHDFGAVTGPRRAGDPASLVADPAEARRVLGFEPRLSSLEAIVRTAWAWEQTLG